MVFIFISMFLKSLKSTEILKEERKLQRNSIRSIILGNCLIRWTTTTKYINFKSEWPQRRFFHSQKKSEKLIVSRSSVQWSQKLLLFVAQCHPFLCSHSDIHSICLETNRRHANIDLDICIFICIRAACSLLRISFIWFHLFLGFFFVENIIFSSAIFWVISCFKICAICEIVKCFVAFVMWIFPTSDVCICDIQMDMKSAKCIQYHCKTAENLHSFYHFIFNVDISFTLWNFCNFFDWKWILCADGLSIISHGAPNYEGHWHANSK